MPTHRLPEGLRVYAVADIHGRHDLLRQMLGLIEADRRDAPSDVRVIFLGDYIDRGPESAQVIDTLLAGEREEGWICLSGNHEALLIAALEGRSSWRRWLFNGGVEALASYRMNVGELGRLGDRMGEAVREAIPPAHIAFMGGLRTHVRFGDYFFCHAGVRPGVALEAQSPEDLIWIRDPFLGSAENHGACIVHGHTPRAEVERLPNRINLDTGAYYSGRLSCAVIEGESVRLLQT